MKTLVAAFITALLVFTLATAWIEVVQPRLDMLALASKPRTRSSTSANKRDARQTTNDEDDDGSSDDSIRTENAKSSRLSKSKRAEAAKKEVLAQLEQVKQREAKLLERQATMEMLYQDIRRELAEVEEIRRRSAAELALAERKVLDAIANKAEINSQANAAENQLRTTARQKAAEASIAAALQDLAKNGNVNAAMTLLSGMQEREVTKVLTSLSTRDPSLALRLSDQVHAAKQGAVRQ